MQHGFAFVEQFGQLVRLQAVRDAAQAPVQQRGRARAEQQRAAKERKRAQEQAVESRG